MAIKIECPYSKARLEEMYWKEGMSTNDIAAHCSNATAVKTNGTSVCRWLKRFGIPVRSNSHAHKVALRVKPELLEKVRVNIAAAREKSADKRRAVKSTNPDWAKARAKGSKVANRKRAEEGWETRVCTHCGKEIRMWKSSFRTPPELTVCSRSCSNKARVERARKAKVEEAITRSIVNLVGYDPRAKTEGE